MGLKKIYSNEKIAWGAYALGRLGDDISSLLCASKHGGDTSIEGNPLVRMWIETFGWTHGLMVHETIGLALAGTLSQWGYKLKGEQLRNSVPITIGTLSVLPVLNNLVIYYFGQPT